MTLSVVHILRSDREERGSMRQLCARVVAQIPWVSIEVSASLA